MTKSVEGMNEAHRLAFACYVENISQQHFDQMSTEQQCDFAVGNAGLDIDQLISAMEYLARYHMARAAALEVYRDGHGHA